MKVLSFGEILFDIIEGRYFLGGAPLNFAAHLAKFGVESYMLSRVGEDNHGDEALAEINKLGLIVDFVGKDPIHPTGTVSVTLHDGHPDYIIHKDAAFDFIELEKAEDLKGISFDVLYIGTLAQRSAVSAIALDRIIRENKFKHIFYDVNLRKDCYKMDIIHRSLDYCNIFKLNDEEVNVLAPMFYNKPMEMEEFIRKISSDFSIPVIIVTAGSEGSFILHNDVLRFVKSYPAEVADTVGAGDSFSAAFVYTFFKTGNIELSGDKANRMGAFVASSKGAIPDYSHEIRNEFIF